MISRFSKPFAGLLTALQDALPITQSELIVVLILLGGLGAGAVFRQCGSTPRNSEVRSEILRLTDSLADAETSTFSGTTPSAEAVPTLTVADTLVRKPKPFPANSGAAKISSGVISLNKAGMEELMRLPGVGRTTAEKILNARQERTFRRIEDVMRVKGIGKKKFEAMKKFLVL